MTLDRLERTARTLGRGARPAKRALPRAWLITEPGRTADPLAAAAALPTGAGIIYRAFGRPDAVGMGLGLVRLARREGLVLLVGADEALAWRIGAAGVHLPERLACRAPQLRARHPNWLVTIAAHSERAVRRAACLGADAVLLSAAFPSRSDSAARALGAVRLAALAGRSSIPVIALGGVNARTAPRLARVYGFAALEGWSAV